MENFFVLLLVMIVMVASHAGVVKASVKEIQNENWPSTDTPIVIVHGAWGGAHDWRFVEKRLNEYGYEVRRVSLIGQGEKSHLISYQNDFSTHVRDVITMINFEYDKNEKLILAGHSYGGTVITAVASQIPERIKKIIYIDAMMPTLDDIISDDDLKNAENKITPGNFLIEPSWPVYWDDSSEPKDVPHQAKTMILPKSEFPKYEEMLKIPGTSMVFAGTDWVGGSQLADRKKTSYEVGKSRGYTIIIKPWNHNAGRDRTDEFYPVFLEAIANAK